ncbi:DUF2059 domain-containing protein [Aureimonas phyllosphaerae]|uniref:DUF2059 domain-containing protein n=1 Tax=Aureimonas phyllosphaerae TaxID=1166078 RepID=A0A7W6BRY0_9HYPH|nr:DUF2059 domain-containing protein [Aureimonas phyllosphaerae]KQQ91323.1 hypothetical protein ASF65_02080 [Aureimonas sp. Leaf324]MBB3935195.1 hypothetical protein [Aureimonas phyllosphaerae]MBB3959203.1 hypothetical protein [Aureimonas phyllosphaerae]SFF06561.1 hypothetical protein SAMN05216566_102220 [Aureimonas phyllosphaerae]
MKLPSETLRRGLCVSVALLGLSVAPAFAQDASPSHIAAARQAVDALDTTEQFDQILLNAATQIKAELIVNNPNLQSEISNMVDDEALKLAPRRGDLENEIARIYAKLFTEQELREIAEFYQGEAGKKLLAQGPTASREMMSAADVWASGIVRDLRNASINGAAKLAPPAQATSTQ